MRSNFYVVKVHRTYKSCGFVLEMDETVYDRESHLWLVGIPGGEAQEIVRRLNQNPVWKPEDVKAPRYFARLCERRPAA